MEYKIATADDIELLMSSRLEMLREVNGLAADQEFSEEIMEYSRDYFLSGDQTTVLALDGGRVIGCATICYMVIMPTYSHPTGRRAHLMNVYTAKDHRRQGVARRMMEMILEDARNNSATEISLDATESGRPLYESMGFTGSDECMVMVL
ncbi:MAG: GNAT family N-acetyltransferase [Clostridiales bacterium]|nr:GNAT family N-acetyltransferase [Clostridiales bacterium]